MYSDNRDLLLVLLISLVVLGALEISYYEVDNKAAPNLVVGRMDTQEINEKLDELGSEIDIETNEGKLEKIKSSLESIIKANKNHKFKFPMTVGGSNGYRLKYRDSGKSERLGIYSNLFLSYSYIEISRLSNSTEYKYRINDKLVNDEYSLDRLCVYMSMIEDNINDTATSEAEKLEENKKVLKVANND